MVVVIMEGGAGEQVSHTFGRGMLHSTNVRLRYDGHHNGVGMSIYVLQLVENECFWKISVN